MISNTDVFYAKAKEYQDARAELVSAYEKRLEGLDKYKGSQGYQKDAEALQRAHSEALKALQDEFRPEFMTILGGMLDAVGKRTVTAPTTDQLNLLSVLRMKREVTLEDCERVARSVADNPLAVSVVTEIAHDHGIPHGFDGLCSEMSSHRAADVVTGLQRSVEDFLEYDTTRVSRLASKFYEDHYGMTAPLTKRTPFTNKEECFRDLGGLDKDDLHRFSEIVDA